MSKAVILEDLESIAVAVLSLRHKGSKVVFTNGCFDLLHVGHIRLLEEAKAQGDVLIVGLNSDSSVTALKGQSRPITTALERAEILSMLRPVDYVFIFDDPTPIRLIRMITPDVHVKGSEYRVGFGKHMPEASVVESLGGRVHLVEMVKDRSTSSIVCSLGNSGNIC